MLLLYKHKRQKHYRQIITIMSSQKGIFMSNWGKRLQEVRLQHEITQNELAQKIGIDTTALSRYERGRGAKQMPSNVKDKLIGIFSVEEITYIDIGKSASQSITGQSITGNYNNQAGGSQTIQTKEQIDDAIINAIVKMLRDFDEEKKLTALHYITEIRRDKIK